ncbi:PA2169 family four-helix-bundle protein [Chryseobacterium indologenes]|uniref:ferritin-like domain-containing protein n=1 Tax=Chryseobacterium indologenes TaxID=253 RepID=UPI000F4F7D2A|nr:PA2169 family four-helix-bundle protein [Chryseobacterium indologenes]AYZ35362.1 PA2169 family four-helix-bundle protein [Chryseobacterium indologenes]MBF6644106.1 PA2169 family four-helix-bundle protein [Chryseobacterium indologenes]MBU3050640.1 PA2169 family four-helix-bundle protein [Chryseobacterium indologenes]MEB4763291.1 PA2169 family four-helix-bundle protein [Chryseobacterium indologenes]QQQ72175.1 PA2169 family four-helix-bundle protein [Chryseobacterium indologenes]
MNNEKTVSVLNDLLNITNDRIEGFKKVEDKVWNTHTSLKSDYDQMVAQSQVMKTELIRLITERGGNPDNTTSTAGALHRAWIDVKNSFSGDKTESTLENVVFGEKAAIKAYEDALDSGDLCPQSTTVVSDQLHHLKSSYRKFETLEERK